MANVTNETEAKEQLVPPSPRIADRTDDDLTLLLATLELIVPCGCNVNPTNKLLPWTRLWGMG